MLVTVFSLLVTGIVAAFAVAVIALFVLRTCVVVCTPVNVLAASVRATVKFASGRVIVRAAVGQENVSN